MQSCNNKAKSKLKEKPFTALHEIRNVQTLIEIEGQTCFSAFARLRELVFGLLAFPAGSPLAGAGG